jgi:hypothetical protein
MFVDAVSPPAGRCAPHIDQGGAVMAPRRAEAISLTDLTKAVDRAVSIAAKRHDLQLERPTFSANWEIFGRIVRDARDFNSLFAFANDVTKAVALRGSDPMPGVIRIGPKDVLCGFIERSGLLRQLGR